jgi:hypothetical protein
MEMKNLIAKYVRLVARGMAIKVHQEMKIIVKIV